MAHIENYFLILGLGDFSPDPSFIDTSIIGNTDEDPAVNSKIEAAIKSKRSEWTVGLKDSRKVNKCRYLLDNVSNFKKGLSTLEQRKAQYEDAKSYVGRTLKKRLTMVQKKGYIFDVEIESIAQSEALPSSVVRQYVSVEIRTQSVKGEALSEPTSVAKYREANALMEPYGIHDLYDFLCAGTRMDRTAVTSASFWHERTEKIKAGLPAHNKQDVADKKKLCEVCLLTFSTENGKQEYDEYLAWSKLQEILAEVSQVASATGMLVTEQAEDFIDSLYAACGDKAKAIAYLRGHCTKNAIAWVVEGSGKHRWIPCPYCLTMVGPTDKICPKCGGEIIVKCPKCGREHSVCDIYCTNPDCRYDFTNFKKAVGLCEQAKNEINVLNLSNAQNLLDEAAHLCSSVKEIAILRAEWVRQNARFGKITEAIRTYAGAKLLIKAKKEIDIIKKQFPQFSDLELEEMIAGGIGIADNAMRIAKSSIDPTKICVNALTAYRACKDYPGTQEILIRYQPKPVTEILVRTDGVNRINCISWHAEQNAVNTFRVIRKRDSKPVDVNDGEILFETTTTNYTDNKITPGDVYYYGVITCIGPVLSTLALSPAYAINLFEVQQLMVQASSTSIQASWSGVPQQADVEVWRCIETDPLLPSTGNQVSNVNRNGMLDQNLKNDQEYTYRIFTKYKQNGTVFHSTGIKFSGIPSSPPRVVDYIISRHICDGHFEVEWDQPGADSVTFYLTTSIPPFTKGDFVDIASLSHLSMRISVTATGPGKGEFTLPGTDIYSMFATTQKNNTVAIGAFISVSAQKLIEIDKIQMSGVDTYIRFEWPGNISHVLLLYRTDHYSTSPQDMGAARKRVTKAIYNLNKAIAISNLPKGTYYFSLFVELEINGAVTYSVPDTKMFGIGIEKNITYEIRPQRTLLGAIKGAEITLNTTAEDGSIPALVVYANNGSLPFFRNQGICIAEIPAQKIEGKFTYNIVNSEMTKNTFLRVFTKDEDDDVQYGVSLKLGSRSDLK